MGFASNAAPKAYEDNGIEQITTGISAAIPFGLIGITPAVNYTFKIDETTVNQLWAGIAVGYSF